VSSIAGEQEDFPKLQVETKSFQKMPSFPRVSNPLIRNTLFNTQVYLSEWNHKTNTFYMSGHSFS